jgi:hypothetical protein
MSELVYNLLVLCLWFGLLCVCAVYVHFDKF